MTAKTKRALVPKLRFPEFRDAGEWDLDLLGNKTISKFIDERVSIDKLNLESYVSTENLLHDYAGVTRATKLPISGSFTCYKKDDVLISNIRPYLKKVWSADKEGTSSNDVIVIRAGERIASNFLVFVLKNDQFIHYVMTGAKGVKMPRGDISSMKEYPVAFPKDDEQKKIADCLTSVDELITLEARKIDALKAHKKGLMQQLFPAEGETLPKLRFPEFRDAGEWEEKKLGEIGNVLMCKRIFAEETNDREGVPFFKIGTLGGIADSFISRQLFDEYRSKYNYPKKGEVLLTCSGTVGKCIPYNGADAYYQDSNIVWIANPTRVISNEFLFYILSSVDWSRLNSTTITRIYGDDLRAISLVFPADPVEQQKIADCLSSLDDLIALQSQKLDALKAHKKGLLQQLFPSPGEVGE